MAMRKVVMQRDKYLCQSCSTPDSPKIATVVDHEIALMNGGTNDYDNLRALCNPCHDAKTEHDKGRKSKQQIGEDGWPV